MNVSQLRMAATPQSHFKGDARVKEFDLGTRMQFVCQHLACRRQIEIEIPPGSGVGPGANMLCICGSKMKKVYAEPVLQELSKAEAILSFGDSWLQKTQGRTAG